MTYEENELQRKRLQAIDEHPIGLYIKDVQQLIGHHEELFTQLPPHIKEEEHPQPLHIKEEDKEPQVPNVKEEEEAQQHPHRKVEEAEVDVGNLLLTNDSAKSENHDDKPSQLHQSSSPQLGQTDADTNDCSRIGPSRDELVLPDVSSLQKSKKSERTRRSCIGLRTMRTKLIVAVSEHPELFDTSCFYYRDKAQKKQAWRVVSTAVGESEDVCRRKWKGLRDAYLKGRKKEKEKSGSAAGPLRILSFLDPFVTPKETSGNTGRGGRQDGEAQMPLEEDPEAAGPRGGKSVSKRSASGNENVEEYLINYLMAQSGPSAPAPPPSEDELFLTGLLPSLQRLPPEKKQFVQFQMHKIIYEAATGMLN